MARLIKIINKIHKCRRGMTLIEVLLALAIMGLTVVFVGGLFTGFNVIPVDADNVYTESIARSQMEDVMNEEYVDDATSYPAMIDVPDGYFVPAPTAEIIDPNDLGTPPASDLGIQRITVYVYKGDSAIGDPVFTLVGYKIKPW